MVRASRTTLAGVGIVAALVLVAAGDVAQRHYFHRRYLVGTQPASSGLGAIYRWAQPVAHARIALYGTVEQYPLYGATDTNVVDYLGQPARDGGYQPITTCRRWRTTLQAGRYRYLVLTPGPTAAIPLSWSRLDPNLTPILHPAAGDWVFRIAPRVRRHALLSAPRVRRRRRRAGRAGSRPRWWRRAERILL